MDWLADSWFTALQTLAIVSGFVFTCLTLRKDSQSRRMENLFQLTVNHRELWERLFERPELRRVLSANADLQQKPVTDDEHLFVQLLILHVNTAHHAIKLGVMDAPEGFGTDLRILFRHPVPRTVWERLRDFQDRDFVAFVEKHISGR
jgi:hypothetical protein